LLLLCFSSCEKDDEKPEKIDLDPKEIELTTKADEVISGNNEFGIDLFRKIAAEENKNLMLSPFSGRAALTMLLNGCAGNTYTQLQETLKYDESLEIDYINEAYKSLAKQLIEADPKVTLAIANAIFYRQGFDVKSDFLDSMSDVFDANIEELDFNLPSALDAINDWASDNTNGKIPEVLDEIDPEHVMFLMNALYFKGDWSYQFDKSLTEQKPFYLDDGNTVNVSTMHGTLGAKWSYSEDYSAIELPYGRSNFSMVVILPSGNLNDFINNFTSEQWSKITNNLDSLEEWGEIDVFMPKFKFSYEKKLNDQLESMGMVDAFDENLADLSGIADTQLPFFVDFVKQDTFIEVNEEGTEAAAVTTVGLEFTSVNGRKTFTIDKPFIFAIRERTTNTLMFIGNVVNPE